MTKEEKVIEELLDLSFTNNWNEAKEEWSLSMVFKLDKSDQCLCGTPIQYVCLMENDKTKAYARVGYACYEEVFANPIAKRLINDVKKISEDPNKTVHIDTLNWLRQKGYYPYKFYDMYRSISSSKSLSERQQQVIFDQNIRILKMLSQDTYYLKAIAHKILFRPFPAHVPYDKSFVKSIDEQLRYTGSISPKQESSLLMRAEKLGIPEAKLMTTKGYIL